MPRILAALVGFALLLTNSAQAAGSDDLFRKFRVYGKWADDCRAPTVHWVFQETTGGAEYHVVVSGQQKDDRQKLKIIGQMAADAIFYEARSGKAFSTVAIWVSGDQIQFVEVQNVRTGVFSIKDGRVLATGAPSQKMHRCADDVVESTTIAKPDATLTTQVSQSNCPPALTAESKKSIDEMLRQATAMIGEKANAAGGYNNRGIAHMYLGKYELALQDFDSERRLIGRNICGNCLARLYLLRGQYDLAIKAIDERRLARASTGEDGLSCFRGMAYHKKGEYDLAIADYEKAMLFADDFRNCGLYGKGLSRIRKGDLPGGKADMAAAVDADATAKYPQQYERLFCALGVPKP